MKLPKIQLSSKTKKLMSDILEPIKSQYVDFFYLKNEARWIQQYNMIKDPSWPDCASYQDFDKLPDWIKKECVDTHGSSPGILLDNIRLDSDRQFYIPDLLTFNRHKLQFLCNHSEVIKDKKIIDFACNQGRHSFLATQMDCKNVIGTDIRPYNIDIADSIKKDLELTDDQINFDISDIHDYQKNQSLCQGKDTAFLLGIMYHVHDHFAILESVFDTGVKHVVIETGIFEHEKPVIWWKQESTFEPLSGWYDNNETILVGYPSVPWFDLVAEKFNFVRTDISLYQMSTSHSNDLKFLVPRAVMLFESLIS